MALHLTPVDRKTFVFLTSFIGVFINVEYYFSISSLQIANQIYFVLRVNVMLRKNDTHLLATFQNGYCVVIYQTQEQYSESCRKISGWI